jgi:hypothetical protein
VLVLVLQALQRLLSAKTGFDEVLLSRGGSGALSAL